MLPKMKEMKYQQTINEIKIIEGNKGWMKKIRECESAFYIPMGF